MMMFSPKHSHGSHPSTRQGLLEIRGLAKLRLWICENPTDLAAAIKEMNGKYVGNRPIRLRKSDWKERTDVDALQRQKNHVQRKPKMPKKGILHK